MIGVGVATISRDTTVAKNNKSVAVCNTSKAAPQPIKETSAAINKRTHPSPLEVFEARCEVRALLYAVGEITLHDAVDELQAAAIDTGVVAEIGQDAVQAIMAAAFAESRP